VNATRFGFGVGVVLLLAAPLGGWDQQLPGRGNAPGAGREGSLVVTLKAGEFEFDQNPDGTRTVRMRGFRLRGDPGEPLLPFRIYSLLLPPEASPDGLRAEVVSSRTRSLPGPYRLALAPPIVPMGRHDPAQPGEGRAATGRPGAEPAAPLFPPEPVRLLPAMRMRKWLGTRFLFTPLRYRRADRSLVLTEEIQVRIVYRRRPLGPDSRLLQDSVLDDIAPEIFDNFSPARAFYGRPVTGKATAGTYDYVIITSNAVRNGSAKLASFAAHKRRRGHRVLVITEDQWGTKVGQAPNHNPEKIRKWLQDNYLGLGINYVLLVGDPYPDWNESVQGEVAMKLCWPWVRNPEYGWDAAPTDYYYADLTGNWDLNGNGYFGEYYDDTQTGGVDIVPEVLVGRIPVYNGSYADLDAVLEKLIEYESESDIAWRRKALLPMSFLSAGYDQAALGEQMRDFYLAPAAFTSFRMYQQGSGPCGADSAYASEAELRGGTGVRDRWAADPPGIVCWAGHGSSDTAMVGYDACWDGVLFDSASCPALYNRRGAFTFQDSCETGYPESAGNLQYALLRRGAAAAVGATRSSWGDSYRDSYGNFDGSPTASGIGYEYLRRVVAGETAGEALYFAKQALSEALLNYQWLMNLYDFNLLGDPALDLYATGPSAATASGDYDGDGRADIAVFRPTTGLWAVRGVTNLYFGGPLDSPVSGDYDGDGTAEVAVYRGTTGLWAARGITRFYFGTSSDLPVPGDYSGDSTSTAALFSPSRGRWLLKNLSRIYFGSDFDLAVPGDYDGDGTTEPAVFRPPRGLWAVRGSTRFFFGNSDDVPLPGNYGGDGTSKAAIFRPRSAYWGVRGVTRVYFGASSDRPVPADFDGDGADDIGIFRDNSGLWAARSLTRAYFGAPGDVPATR